MSSTPASAVNAGIPMQRPQSMGARRVSATGTTHILTTPITPMGRLNAGGISCNHAYREAPEYESLE